MKNRNGAGKASGNSQGHPERLKLGLYVSQNVALSGSAFSGFCQHRILYAVSLYSGKACYLHTNYMELLLCLPQPCGSAPGPNGMKMQKISPGFLNALASTTTFFFIDSLVISVHTTYKATPPSQTFPVTTIRESCVQFPVHTNIIIMATISPLYSAANNSCG